MKYGPMIIIILGIICTLLLVAVFYFLFLNRGNDSVVPILFKVCAAVLAAVVMLAIDLSKAPEVLHSKTNFLVLRNKDGDLLNLLPVTVALSLPQWHAYRLLGQTWLFKGYKPQTESFAIDEHVFDELLAATFLEWMAHHYSIHWEMEHNYVTGISGGGGHASQKEGRDKETATYRFADSQNGFLVNDQPSNKIQLPKGSEASLRTTSLESVFTVKNRHMTFTFKALRLGNSGVSHSILGDKIDAHLKAPGSTYAQDYIITLDATFSRGLRWSPQTNKQKEWMKQVFSNFERDFNWDAFKPQFENAIEGLPEDTMLDGIPLRIIQKKDTGTKAAL